MDKAENSKSHVGLLCKGSTVNVCECIVLETLGNFQGEPFPFYLFNFKVLHLRGWCVCVAVHHMNVAPCRPEESTEFPGTGVRDGCAPPPPCGC